MTVEQSWIRCAAEAERQRGSDCETRLGRERGRAEEGRWRGGGLMGRAKML
jgi:hypothetical protein